MRRTRRIVVQGHIIGQCETDRTSSSSLQPSLVFLGADERSAPEAHKSLPLSKPSDDSTLESHSPYGIPYWALDATDLSELKAFAVSSGEGFEWGDMRAGMQTIPEEDAAIGGEGRALLDWNRRNVVSRRPGICGRREAGFQRRRSGDGALERELTVFFPSQSSCRELSVLPCFGRTDALRLGRLEADLCALGASRERRHAPRLPF